MAVVCGVLPERTAFAHDAPIIAPTRLDFDATRAAKKCAEKSTFLSILGAFLPPAVLSTAADRRLVVRIGRSPRGGMVADVTLLDAMGATLAEDHKTYASTTECHKVLYETAKVAARLMGAFDKPLAHEPVPCPACPAPAEPLPCPVSVPPPSPIIASVQPLHRTASPAQPQYRTFLSAGVFLGNGINSQWVVGPYASFGFVPSPHSREFRLELDGAWTSQTLAKSNALGALKVDAVPLFGSLCYAHAALRLCSGLATIVLDAKHVDRLSRNDAMRVTLAATLRLGATIEVAGPFSIRVDAYALVPFWQRTFGPASAALDTSSPLTTGAAAMGVWALE